MIESSCSTSVFAAAAPAAVPPAVTVLTSTDPGSPLPVSGGYAMGS